MKIRKRERETGSERRGEERRKRKIASEGSKGE